jgi:hypothetical protein
VALALEVLSRLLIQLGETLCLLSGGSDAAACTVVIVLTIGFIRALVPAPVFENIPGMMMNAGSHRARNPATRPRL